jgi:2,4-dienoyl-CoA reductase-like NADH-dependent reductase (Old Yellow Enzyme family)
MSCSPQILHESLNPIENQLFQALRHIFLGISLMSRAGSILFSPHRVGPIMVKNRFLRSATWDTFAHADGTPEDRALEMVLYLAQGDVGLIVPSGMSCNPNSIAKGTFGMTNSAHVAAWRPVIESIHTRGNKVFFQINHQGLRPRPGLPSVGPTAHSKTDHALSNSEIEDIIQMFVKSCALSVESGVDGVQLHCCHGFLLSSFLSPALNKRTDKWGGTFENRSRIVHEIIAEVRRNHPTIAISIKMNGNDHIPGGITPETAPDVVRTLVKDVDLFEVSCGVGSQLFGIASDFNPVALKKDVPIEKQATFLKLAKAALAGVHFEEEFNRKAVEAIRREVPEATLALVGGHRQFSKMEKLVLDGVTDFVSLSRPLLKNPFLVRDFFQAKANRSDCINCAACILNLDEGVFCHMNKERIW